MFYKLIENKRNEWLKSEDCTVRDLLKYIARLGTSGVDEAIMIRNGDVDGDGRLTVKDATYIQRYLAKLSVPYPINQYVEVQ